MPMIRAESLRRTRFGPLKPVSWSELTNDSVQATAPAVPVRFAMDGAAWPGRRLPSGAWGRPGRGRGPRFSRTPPPSNFVCQHRGPPLPQPSLRRPRQSTPKCLRVENARAAPAEHSSHYLRSRASAIGAPMARMSSAPDRDYPPSVVSSRRQPRRGRRRSRRRSKSGHDRFHRGIGHQQRSLPRGAT